MNDRFGGAAMYLCALAARALGWRPDEFWAATPAELAACLADPAAPAAAPLGRCDLQRLMESDPDGHG
ncbi:phage tail assembly chaperone [Tsuneonella sp. SYSU-LHT278]|uniref:phage tail assembly chaperone n=1 Tax=Tsuneonella sediminis TaxID=3416089 RepID=UPI003F795DE0